MMHQSPSKFYGKVNEKFTSLGVPIKSPFEINFSLFTVSLKDEQVGALNFV